MPSNEEEDPRAKHRGQRLYNLVRIASIANHMVDNPALADKIKAATLPHALPKRAEEGYE